MCDARATSMAHGGGMSSAASASTRSSASTAASAMGSRHQARQARRRASMRPASTSRALGSWRVRTVCRLLTMHIQSCDDAATRLALLSMAERVR